MFRKILYPTDFSDVSKKALASLSNLKTDEDQEVVIIHVIDSRNLDAMAQYVPADLVKTQEALEKLAWEEAQAITDQLEKAGFKVTVRIEEGIPSRNILEAEADEDVSCIVIGSHGVSNIKEMFLGSVSEKVIRKAKKPVIVIKR
ncbi:MAG: universal stress protein [Deltaproteobacteria bacterium]|nr:universal stress protein [Deltaproteobacteria bacterium]